MCFFGSGLDSVLCTCCTSLDAVFSEIGNHRVLCMLTKVDLDFPFVIFCTARGAEFPHLIILRLGTKIVPNQGLFPPMQLLVALHIHWISKSYICRWVCDKLKGACVYCALQISGKLNVFISFIHLPFNITSTHNTLHVHVQLFMQSCFYAQIWLEKAYGHRLCNVTCMSHVKCSVSNDSWLLRSRMFQNII